MHISQCQAITTMHSNKHNRDKRLISGNISVQFFMQQTSIELSNTEGSLWACGKGAQSSSHLPLFQNCLRTTIISSSILSWLVRSLPPELFWASENRNFSEVEEIKKLNGTDCILQICGQRQETLKMVLIDVQDEKDWVKDTLMTESDTSM